MPKRLPLVLLTALCALASPLQAAPVADAMGGIRDGSIEAALGRVSALWIQKSISRLVSFGTRSTLSRQDAASITSGRGIGAAREWIRAEFERYSRDCGGCLKVKVDSFIEPPAGRIPEPTRISNVYAVLKGTAPSAASRIVLVTGHYDSRNSDGLNALKDAPGANDDASGTAVSLECARVLSQMRFPATIIFLTVAGEEQGLFGSAHFAQMARSQGWNIEAVLNNDIVGGNLGPGQNGHVVRVFSEGIPVQADEAQMRRIRQLGTESDSPSRELARYIAQTGALYDSGLQPLLVFRLDRFLRGGDHSSFNQQGYSAVRFTEFREDFARQHQDVRSEDGIDYGDRIEYVDFEYVARVTRLNAATLAMLALAPAAPSNVKLLTGKLENDSTFSWEPSEGASDYEILWRDTSSPQWEFAQRVGDVRKATVEISKDNVIFGVRALDAAGHAGLPGLPVPER
jgi:Peptidase family M28